MHWGDSVTEKTARFGPLTLGIDPVAAQAPTALDTGDAGFLLRYSDFMLAAAEGRVGFVKFQSAFFEAYGSAGITALAASIGIARARGYGIILDVKRGDIGSTAEAYAQAYLDPACAGGSDLEADCVTVNPFLGPETLEPYVERARRHGKGVLVLVKTSNPGSRWLQDEMIDGVSVSGRTAALVSRWADETTGESGVGAVGAVVGATYPEQGRELRRQMPRAVILAPGLGSQGGDAAAVARLRTETGPVLAPISRGLGTTNDRAMPLEDFGALVERRLREYAAALTLEAAVAE
jgi:orotidine-5'-phosphate decarboxylase